MKTGRLKAKVWRAALGVALVCAFTGLMAASFAAGSGASPDGVAGPYAGSAVPAAPPEPKHEPARTLPATTPSPAPSASPAPSPATPTLAPSPVVLAAATTPVPETEAPPPAVTPVPARPACPPYSILLDPAPDLAAATQGAMGMWSAYLGCPAFEIAGGGLAIRYEPGWPGDCLDPDFAACTMNGIFLSPVGPLHDARSVIAHELGHVLNFGHGEGPAVMDPAHWSGPLTVWCDLETRCD